MLKAIEPSEIAIIGYGCRLPGADGPEGFRALLEDGRCSVGRIQPDRFPADMWLGEGAGRSYTLAAGQLDDPFAFDPGFFGVSPREAEQMDPQQRLLLQVAWEALEHARRPLSTLARDRTGVFVGASSNDHSNRFHLDPGAIDAQFMTGNTLSLLSNRISYLLDLQGPSWTVDTACSSGLYALRAAAAEIASGRIDTALVGGVNMLLSPWPYVGFSRASMLSRRGLCAAFDASGDGYVRSEGAVVFVLKALGAALADGDHVLGVIAGVGVNSDGRTPGVSMPSAERQEALLRQVYGELGLSPDRLAFVEAHGTGTQAGDPQEAAALGAALGAGRAAPLPIGSAKTNVGHLEAGAGLVGLLKAQIALETGRIPRSLHFETPNPHIDFDRLNLRVAAEAEAIPPASRPWHAGVNAFGFGGANAHVCLRQPGAEERRSRAPEPAPAPLVLSARSEEALKALAGQVADRLRAAPGDAPALANACAWGRERLSHRVVVPAAEAETQAGALAAWAAGAKDAPARIASGRAEGAAPGEAVFLFSGNGGQHVGMGRDALARDPDFAAGFRAAAAAVGAVSGQDLEAELLSDTLADRLGASSLAQPLIFAIQVGATGALAARGLRPHAVVGHSVGEVAAAWAAGALDLSAAAQLIHHRSAAQEGMRGTGGMTALLLGHDEAAGLLAELGEDAVEIAADNSPRAVTLSGPVEALARVEAAADARRAATRRLALDYPFHSAAADGLEDGLMEALAFLRPEEARIRFHSAVFGRAADGEELGPRYWWANIRRPVLFRQALGSALDFGAAATVEVGPRPVLGGFARDVARAKGLRLAALAALEDGKPADFDLVAGAALAHGARLSEETLFGPDLRCDIHPPRYPWRNKTYRAAPGPDAIAGFDASPVNPLLGRRDRADGADWHAAVSAAQPAWLADHKVAGGVVMPAAGLADMALSAGLEALGEAAEEGVELLDFDILRPLALDAAPTALRTRHCGARGVVEIAARPVGAEAAPALHAQARLRPLRAAAPGPAAATGAGMDPDAVYAAAAAMGLDYGPAFRRAEAFTRIEGGVEIRFSGDPALAPGRHALHPCWLDAALHGLLPLLAGADPRPGRAWLPVRIAALRLFRPGATPLRAEARLEKATEHGAVASIALFDAAGCVAELSGLRFRPMQDPRAAGAEGLFLRQVLVPVSPAAPPDMDALAAALSGEAAPEPAAALLLDAAAHRSAWEAAAALAGEGGALDPDALPAGALHPSARPLWRRLVAGLEADGSAVPGLDGPVLGAPSAPALEPLAEALLAEAARQGEVFLAAMGLEEGLRRALSGGLAPETPPPSAADIAAEARGPEAEAREAPLIAALAALSGPGRRRILVLGAASPALLRAAMAAGEATRSDPDPRRVRAMEADPAPRPAGLSFTAPEAWEAGAWDVVLSCDALHRADPATLRRLAAALRAGGALIAAEAPPTLAGDLLHGRRSDWWRAAASLRPHGPRRDRAGWAEALDGAGLALHDTGAGPLLARALHGAAPAAPGPRAPIRVVGAGGEALARALALRGQPAICTPWDVPASGETALLMPPPGEDPLADVAALCDRVRRALVDTDGPLWLVLGAGIAAGEDRALSPRDAALWGFARVAANEWPGREIRVIDRAAAGLDRLAEALVEAGPERELVLAADAALAPRAEPDAGRARAAAAARLGDAAGLRLSQRRRGALDGLAWTPFARQAPADGQVEIAVAAAGLNFRDVMWAQGLLPEEALEDGFAGPGLGMECAGVVTRAGAASGFAPGERVLAFAPRALASHALTDAAAVMRLPEGLSPEAAAAAPVAFLTAWHGLVGLARLAPGEVALIHGAAGGVGLAAVQVAQAAGAEVIATAGSPARRAALRRLGCAHVFDSREGRFADAVMRATGGRGVDVALNSLSGEAAERTLECLAPFGRFIELGKRDFYGGGAMGLRPFRRNLAYFGVDVDQLLGAKPADARRAMQAVAEGLARGDYAPPPRTVFGPEEAAEAFRLLQRSGQVGKIVIRPPGAPGATAPAARFGEGAALVVGGLGGFGAEAALRLAERGAEAIWLTSRSGAPAEGAEAALERIRATGAALHLRAVDAADEGAMAALLAEIRADGRPLTAVLHAAAAMDDGLIAGQDAGRMTRAMAAKIAGAEALDRLTRDDPPAVFALFSSATGLVGNPGQGAYVAANCYLEALAAERRRAGLPALAVGFGAISDAGMLTRDAASRRLLDGRLGAAAMSAAEALDALEDLLAAPPPGLAAPVAARIDWAAAGKELALLRTPLFARVEIPEAAPARGAAALRALLAGMPEEEARAEVLSRLCAEAARILRLPLEELDPARPLTELGFDSLMAMDLRLAAEEALGVDIPLLSAAGGATLADLAARAAARLLEGEEAEAQAPDAAALARMAERHGAEAPEAVIDGIARRAAATTRALD
ncbi:SDR family NAD(P)-dependent oxidoreductase [Rhodovulum sp. DZ06]|uniref:SDR family NAD(P)-dependent oxidoreductase n=1 Tax=Rhodovulum sp. DZ06 TaxID=3425126 RepID=UPI003D3583EF